MNAGDTVYSTDGEVFNYDRVDLDVGETYYKGTVVEIRPESLVHEWAVDDIVERMEEALFEEVGEIAEGNLSLSEDKSKELHRIIVEFMKNNCSVSCYKVENITEHTVTEADLS